jgi:AcrR family transcriptional regulator
VCRYKGRHLLCGDAVRLKGSRNADHQGRRQSLLGRLRGELKRAGPRRPTLRELARACGCSVSTLNHYFGRRDDIIHAVFEDTRERAARHLDRVRQTDLPFDASVRAVVDEAWAVLVELGAARTLAIGLIEGLGSPRLGAAYLSDMFDPFILALKERLALHVARGEMRAVDTRMAALALASPMLLTALHQKELQGDTVLPLDCGSFLDHLATGFVRSYGLEDGERGPVPPAREDADDGLLCKRVGNGASTT